MTEISHLIHFQLAIKILYLFKYEIKIHYAILPFKQKSRNNKIKMRFLRNTSLKKRFFDYALTDVVKNSSTLAATARPSLIAQTTKL